ncbi:hypothetical protein MARU1_000394 [Malassezia arunalokei]|uniref:Solute carrier family 12 member 3 n=1 Tax=Malassezia arunalokei TaxID=1514897 RepID=A0AAJ5YYR1_9BASI|nr:hypothetical protein MARU1_000394 [Malassezia arunalokei]
MSRFVSADEADYASLQEQLLHRSGNDDGADQMRASVSGPIDARSSSASLRSSRASSSQADSAAASPSLVLTDSSPLLHGSGIHGRSSAMHHASLSSHEVPVMRKLGTWDGVFMPVTLNVLGIILFLRFGFILGQAGLIGALALLVGSYAIDTLTVLSLNAISTNGQVRGGGAYYLISRSLGPEFGGSIGLVFFFGQAFNAAMNTLGCVEILVNAFGESKGYMTFMPEGSPFLYLYGTITLWMCTFVCLFGSSLFTRATLMLAIILSLAILSIPLSSFLVEPFEDSTRSVYYSGWNWITLAENMWPNFTSGAAGSSTMPGKENWRSVFGVLFPAVCGILAGSSMSGDLRKPSKSIPKGTNWALIFTFGIYALCFVVLAATVPRESFYTNVMIVEAISRWPSIVLMGELASCVFSALMGVMGCAKILQAIARDDLLPFLAPFAQGTAHADVPTYAVLFTALLCQCVLLLDSINLIAQLVTMTTLLTFGVLSAATCALKAGGAPSFRPSFRYWNIWTAGAGTIASLGTMLVTDSYTAGVCIAVTVLLFILIQVFSPPKPWGDVSHNVTYHFVRKYLLRLDERKGHVKYWRPQILLLANDPRKEWNLIIFCNSLKKGALYILGHVLQGQFHDCLPELRQTHLEWLKLVDVSGVKGFVDVVIARDVREGARNLILSCGLGGMRPNIIVLGFPTALQRASEHRRGPVARVRPSEPPSVRSTYTQPIDGTKYVGILEDALALNKALAVAYGFDAMDLPGPSKVARYEPALGEQYIDLWPIQMATHVRDEAPSWDTYTMVLQLGTILSFTGTWRQHKLRVNVFVEHVDEIASERLRVRTLLDNLRIPASLRVFCLSGHVPRYDAIVLGKRALDSELTEVLQDDPWWKQVCDMRRREELQKQMKHKAEPIDAGARRGSPSLPSIDGRRRACQSRQMGVSLPEEHLAYHYNNIRLGLSHPDAHDRQDDDSDYASFQLDAENTYDELESELASLAVDWDPAYLIRARRAKQQQREAQSDGPYGVSYGTLSSSQRTVTPATVHTQDARPRRRTEVRSPHTSPRSAPETAPLVPAMTRGGRALTFNDLPNHAQYLILNELIRRYSTRSTSVVLTALPAPAPGTSTSERDSLAYLHQLQSLYSGGPPVLGVHATTLTMTMTL